jgi:hypothetical protein
MQEICLEFYFSVGASESQAISLWSTLAKLKYLETASITVSEAPEGLHMPFFLQTLPLMTHLK